MRAGKFLCIGWLPILLCSLALLALTLAFKWRHIEGELKQSTATNLVGKQPWAKVETYNLGRDVLLVGSPPNEAALKDALTLAENTYGVRSATHNGDPFAESIAETEPQPAPIIEAPALNPAELKATLSGNTLELSGVLANQTEIDRIYAEATQAFPNTDILNNLGIADNTASLADTQFIGALQANADNGSPVTAHLNQGVLRLIGTVSSTDVKESVENNARQYFDGSISNELLVAAAPIIKRDLCQDSINTLMSSATINFDTGKAIISANSTPLLDNIADTAKRCPDANFEVGGHTDSTGQLSSNITLSQQRANAVVNYLVNKGLASERFIARGYGPEQPIADNSTSQGRAQNRRIEFKLSN